MNKFFKIAASWFFSLSMISFLEFAPAQTISYTNAGVYTNVVPVGVQKATFKLWGAGGGGSLYPTMLFSIIAFGGGGAFSSVTLDVQPGDTFVIVVGQRGSTNNASLGGAGSGNTEGGAPGSYTNNVGRSQGGQASSVFFMSNNFLVMKTVAGGGGGAGVGADGGAGGQPGSGAPPSQAGQPGMNGAGGFGGSGNFGGNYNASATNTGLSGLNQAGGNGGPGVIYSGGGGGGYGGGGGGSSDPMSGGSGGGGGGSYGTSVINGGGSNAGNQSDPNYVGTAGQGGLPGNPGSDGLAVIKWVPTPVPTLVSPSLLADGSFRLSFTNVSGATLNALATTNVGDSSSWSVLGMVTEVSPGQFQYTDTQATNYPQRFYRIRSQ